MLSLLVNPHLFPLIAFLTGGFFLLLVNGLSDRPTLSGRLGARAGGVLFLLLIALGITGAYLDYAPGFWAPPLGLASIYFLFFVLPSSRAQTVVAWLGRTLSLPRARFMAILLACGVAAALSLTMALNMLPTPLLLDICDYAAEGQTVQLAEATWGAAYTDQGSPIVLKTNLAPNAGRLDADSLQDQFEMLARYGLRDQVIHVPLGWQNCNCHGWVFTNGQFWLPSSEVDAILRDNRYRPVASVRAGDLAVYRSPESGAVTHTGVVRYVSGDGHTILVESKWGRLGRFIHPHDVHCYGLDECSFHRSSRIGHRLLGISPDTVPSLPPLEPMGPRRPVSTPLPFQERETERTSSKKGRTRRVTEPGPGACAG